jgi:hypothetical protein
VIEPLEQPPLPIYWSVHVEPEQLNVIVRVWPHVPNAPLPVHAVPFQTIGILDVPAQEQPLPVVTCAFSVVDNVEPQQPTLTPPALECAPSTQYQAPAALPLDAKLAPLLAPAAPLPAPALPD